MHSAEVQANHTWGKFSAFRVLGDHEPMPGFRLVMQFAPRAEAVMRLLEQRSRSSDPLDSELSARLAVLLGEELIVHGHIFEFPDLGIARRAFLAALEWVDESTSLRSTRHLGSQMRGQGQPFSASSIESIEGQIGTLRAGGVDLEQLPHCWWRGVAARFRSDGGVELYDDVPHGQDFAALVSDV